MLETTVRPARWLGGRAPAGDGLEDENWIDLWAMVIIVGKTKQSAGYSSKVMIKSD